MLKASEASKPLVQLIFYNNPDGYPPIINNIRLLAHFGYDVELFCRDDGQDWGVDYPASAKIHRLRGATGSSARDYGQFLKRVLAGGSRRAQVFIGHDIHGFLPARLLASWHRRPLFYHSHDYADANDAKRITARGVKIVRDFEQRFARTAHTVIVPDADRAHVMRRELRLKNEPVIIANAPLLEKIRQIPTNSPRLRAALEAQGRSFERIVFRQGRIGDGHGLEATVRSLPFWKPNWGLAIMGPGEPAYLDFLRSLSRELGVEKRFAILPPVGYDEVVHFTVGADVGHALYQPLHINNVHISTASNKIMEYLSVGLPLLVSPQPALRALVEKHRCGVVADEGDPRAIAEAVHALLESDGQAAELGKASRAAFENVFCYERQFTPMLELLEGLKR